MIRVLHVTNAYPYPDVPEYGVFVKEQIESIQKAETGVTGDVLFMNGRRDGKRAYLDGIKRLRSVAANYDVIHCHHLYSSFVAFAAMTHKPIIVSFLNDWLHEMDGVNSKIARIIGCNLGTWRADRVIFKSPIPAKFRNISKFHHIPNGANIEQFKIVERDAARSALGLDKDTVYLLFVSSKDKNRPQKRYDRFVSVVEAVRSRMPDRKIEELVLVNQPRDRVLNFFNAANLHLMTSDFEGSPNSVKEALCCGTPVVTTNVGNVEDMLMGISNCYVSSSFEVAELAELVEMSLKSLADRHAIRNSFISRRLTQEATVFKLVEIYRELATRDQFDKPADLECAK